MVESITSQINGLVYAWGRNTDGMLGCKQKEISKKKSDASLKFLPTLVKSISNIKSVHAFTNYSMAVTNEGTVYGWGSNKRNRMGLS